MATAQLSIADVINVSVAAVNQGVNAYNTSNLCILTHEPPASGWSGATPGYGIYNQPTTVGTDFGSASQTYAMANAIFSQSPNILAGTTPGNLIIIPLIAAVQTLTFSATAASGAFVLNWGGNATSSIAWNATAATIQSDLQALSGLSSVTVTGSISSGTLTVTFLGVYGPASALTITSNTLETSGSAGITVSQATTTAGETIGAAITRTSTMVQYFGVMGATIFSQTDMLAAAAIVQAMNKIAFFVSASSSDVQPGGMLDLLRSGSLTQSRGLYYGGTNAQAIGYMASYAGRALSVDFNGSNTATDMHMKQLAGVQPDPTMTQTILSAATTAGADCYVSIMGDSCVFASGANWFFDRVYNLQWFVGGLQVAAYNYLAGASTKIPQTEDGMTGFKAALRQVCKQAVINQYLAPGTWTSSTTFGNQALMISNIAQNGYYIYSAPVNQQTVSARTARQAPLVQIAIKEAGSIDSSSIQINVNP